jgi:hypothetical protein
MNRGVTFMSENTTPADSWEAQCLAKIDLVLREIMALGAALGREGQLPPIPAQAALLHDLYTKALPLARLLDGTKDSIPNVQTVSEFGPDNGAELSRSLRLADDFATLLICTEGQELDPGRWKLTSEQVEYSPHLLAAFEHLKWRGFVDVMPLDDGLLVVFKA